MMLQSNIDLKRLKKSFAKAHDASQSLCFMRLV
jgi:hypothetical protein